MVRLWMFLDGVPDPDAYKDLFTINEFMTPFAPIDPVTFEKNPFRAIINMPSSALHMRIKEVILLITFTRI